MAVSIGQAAAQAVADWLKSALPSDVTVLAQWPVNGPQVANKTVSVTKIGRRRRVDIAVSPMPMSVLPLVGAMARVTMPVGYCIQPIQLDIWCIYDVDRENLIDQLDDALTAGMDQTLGGGITDDPVKDGIVVQLPPISGFTGVADCWFDEPDLTDDPQSVQRSQFRATYMGEVHMVFARVRQVPLILAATVGIKSSEQANPPATVKYDTTTIPALTDDESHGSHS